MDRESVIIRCRHCGVKNRIPKTRIGEGPVCGKCKSSLSIEQINDRPVNVTDNTFASEVLSFPGPVLLDCWAPWCGPCRMVGPVLEQLASEYAGRVKIAKLNVDENPQVASQYAVKSIPTMLLFKNGKKVDSMVGALPKEEIARHLRPLF
ncbi:MAG: thioredoxin TrxC [Deltaproteobacteria bacterium]|nr:thioredoxin TrxC [Deltaproteobacteria bacterium]